MPQTTLAKWLTRQTQAPPLPQGMPKEQLKDSEASETSSNDKKTTRHELPLSIPFPTAAIAAVYALPRLPANVTLEPCQEKYLQAYRRINALLLPIPYRDDFYRETMENPVIASVTRLALWHEKPNSNLNTSPEARLVAAIRCRVLETPPDNPYEKTPVLYISTITTLAPFRGHALATHLLATVVRIAIEEHGIKAVMGHVWEANDAGMEWYKKRGFRVVAHEPEYYRRLAPKTAALVIRKDVGPGDLLLGLGSSNASGVFSSGRTTI